MEIVAANKPEVEGGIYTGDAQIFVNNNNLETIVESKEYICGRNEKKILESTEYYPSFSKKGLFIFGNI